MLHNISTEIKITFFKFLARQITITNFEKWVYQTVELEQALKSDDYIELLSLDFNQRSEKLYLDIYYKINKIIEKYIDFAEYNTWKLKTLLYNFLHRKGDLAKTLAYFYDLRFYGYGFLYKLGLDYGLNISCYLHEIDETSVRYFFPDDYTAEEVEQEIKRKINDILPEVDREIKKVLFWLEQGKIKIINKSDYIDEVDYIDKRSESEKNT